MKEEGKKIIMAYKKTLFINIIFIIFLEPIFAFAINLADGSGSSSGSTPYEIPPEIKSNCEKNIPLYKSVAQEAGLPWQALAAIHFREANCDPNKSSVSGEELGSRNPDDGNVYSTLEESLKATAAHLKGNAKLVYNVELTENPDDASLGWAFLAYNRGRMYRDGVSASGSSCGAEWKNTHYDKSPYVVNFIDENHKNMKWNGCIDSNMTHADARAGALTIYKLLGGESTGADVCADIEGGGETVDKEKLKTSLAEMYSSGKYGGGPNASGVNEYLETFEVPIWTERGEESKMRLTAHKEVVGSLKSIFQELTAMKYPINPSYTGAFRHEQGGGSGDCISAHRFGVAIDVNWDVNPYCDGICYGYGPRKVTPEVAKVFEKHGWTVWGAHKSDGGDFSSISDSMHFSVNDPKLLSQMCQ